MTINPDGTVTISRSEYDSLLDDSKTLSKLEAAGVDNWEGYSYAFEDDYDEDDD